MRTIYDPETLRLPTVSAGRCSHVTIRVRGRSRCPYRRERDRWELSVTTHGELALEAGALRDLVRAHRRERISAETLAELFAVEAALATKSVAFATVAGKFGGVRISASAEHDAS